MKQQGKSIFIVFIVAGVFAGILGMHLSAGTAVADKGGLPQCKAELEICHDTAAVPQTGQIDCHHPGDDGDLLMGIALPVPRFVDNGDGTVTDNLTELIWTKEATLILSKWSEALDYCSTLENGYDPHAGLSDGSIEGDWRLPNVRELFTLYDFSRDTGPFLPEGHPFTGAEQWFYWTSTTSTAFPEFAFTINHWSQDAVVFFFYKLNAYKAWVWCVRGGM
jgi:hypothetical protein